MCCVGSFYFGCVANKNGYVWSCYGIVFYTLSIDYGQLSFILFVKGMGQTALVSCDGHAHLIFGVDKLVFAIVLSFLGALLVVELSVKPLMLKKKTFGTVYV